MPSEFKTLVDLIDKRRAFELASNIESYQVSVERQKAKIGYWKNVMKAFPQGTPSYPLDAIFKNIEFVNRDLKTYSESVKKGQRKFNKFLSKSIDYQNIWTQLHKRQMLEKVELSKGKLVIFTKMFKSNLNKKVEKGRFKITIGAGGSIVDVRFQNLDYIVENGNTYQLAHIKNGLPCWGSFENDMRRYYSNGEILLLIDIILYYLEVGESENGGYYSASAWYRDRKAINPKAGKPKPIAMGDRVKLTGRYTESESNPLWGGRFGKIGGNITNIIGDRYEVLWNNKKSNTYFSSDLTRLPKPRNQTNTNF